MNVIIIWSRPCGNALLLSVTRVPLGSISQYGCVNIMSSSIRVLSSLGDFTRRLVRNILGSFRATEDHRFFAACWRIFTCLLCIAKASPISAGLEKPFETTIDSPGFCGTLQSTGIMLSRIRSISTFQYRSSNGCFISDNIAYLLVTAPLVSCNENIYAFYVNYFSCTVEWSLFFAFYRNNGTGCRRKLAHKPRARSLCRG